MKFTVEKQSPSSITMEGLEKHKPIHICHGDICDGCLIDWELLTTECKLSLSYSVCIEHDPLLGLIFEITELSLNGHVQCYFTSSNDVESVTHMADEFEVILEEQHGFTIGYYMKPEIIIKDFKIYVTFN